MKFKNVMFKFGRRIALIQNSMVKTLSFTLGSILTVVTVYAISLAAAQILISMVLALITAALFYIAIKPTINNAPQAA